MSASEHLPLTGACCRAPVQTLAHWSTPAGPLVLLLCSAAAVCVNAASSEQGVELSLNGLRLHDLVLQLCKFSLQTAHMLLQSAHLALQALQLLLCCVGCCFVIGCRSGRAIKLLLQGLACCDDSSAAAAAASAACLAACRETSRQHQ